MVHSQGIVSWGQTSGKKADSEGEQGKEFDFWPLQSSVLSKVFLFSICYLLLGVLEYPAPLTAIYWVRSVLESSVS